MAASLLARISELEPVEPRYRSPQQHAIEWISAAHARAEALGRGNLDILPEIQVFMRRAVSRFGASPEQVAFRGHHLEDFEHFDWERMRIFELDRFPGGRPISERMAVHEEVVNGAFAKLYAGVSRAPAHLIHVSCTGYVSPSAAQRVVCGKGWSGRTGVTHAYHMGCYASLPAIRLGAGLLALSPEGGAGPAAPEAAVDVVHTELCTLHLNPSINTPEQWVVESLFADGIIRYRVRSPRAPSATRELGVLAIREEQVPDTEKQMEWAISEQGMRMTLSRDVPSSIARSLGDFVRRLREDAGWEGGAPATVFAIHPGGPRIIQQIQGQLGLADAQVGHSREVLRDRGNMSSATLPHIWKAILDDRRISPGTPVVSLAFGPGLTLFGMAAIVGGEG